MFAGLLCIQRPSRRRPVRRQAQDQEIAELRAERDGLKADIENAVKCAKEYAPDYPWSDNTASECVWALGEGLRGLEKANDDMHRDYISKLPKTADGIPITLGMVVYSRSGTAYGATQISPGTTEAICQCHGAFARDDNRNWYSTRAAALAALNQGQREGESPKTVCPNCGSDRPRETSRDVHGVVTCRCQCGKTWRFQASGAAPQAPAGKGD